MAPEIELPEIQGNILCAYALPLTRYCHFRFDTPEAGQAFVGAVTPEVTTAEDKRPDGGSWSLDKPESTVNIAFTFMEPLPMGVPIALISAGLLSRRRRVGAAAASRAASTSMS